MDYKIFVEYKDSISDPEAQYLKTSIFHIGIKKDFLIKVAQVYRISGDISKSAVEEICKKILADPITQTYYVETPNPSGKIQLDSLSINKKFFSIEVFYKKGVTDAVAETVKIAIKDIGIHQEISVRTGKRYTICGDFSKDDLKKIAEGVLSNTVVQEYKINFST